MDLDTARQLLQDFELILGIAQQGVATIREFTEGPDFAPEASLNLTVEDLTNIHHQHLSWPPPMILMNNFLKFIANNLSLILMNNFLIIGLHPLHRPLLTKTSSSQTRQDLLTLYGIQTYPWTTRSYPIDQD